MSTSTETEVSTLKRMAGKVWSKVAPAIVIAIPVMIIVIWIISGTELPWRSNDFPGDNGGGDRKQEKTQDQISMDQAEKSQNGQILIGQGYDAPLTAVKYPPLVDFLDKQIDSTGKTAGSYVQFTKNTTGQLPERYDDKDAGGLQAEPDVILDATSGVMVALSKNYSNGRGLTCFSPEDPRNLSAQTFNAISAAVWNMSLEQVYTHTEVSVIPEGV